MNSFMNFSEIYTKRLKVRRFNNQDLAEILSYRNDIELARYTSWDQPLTQTDGITMINKYYYLHPDTPGKKSCLGIELMKTGQLIGELSLRTDPIDTSQVEFSIAIAHRFQNLGLACEASKGIFNFLFHRQGKNKIKALSDARNIKFIEFLKKIGMQQEAFFRENLLHRDQWCDQLLLAVLKREWPQTCKTAKLDLANLFSSQ
ncbi:MAG: GNAT family N-acetyltransferase [Oligoflexales bacterium]